MTFERRRDQCVRIVDSPPLWWSDSSIVQSLFSWQTNNNKSSFKRSASTFYNSFLLDQWKEASSILTITSLPLSQRKFCLFNMIHLLQTEFYFEEIFFLWHIVAFTFIPHFSASSEPEASAINTANKTRRCSGGRSDGDVLGSFWFTLQIKWNRRCGWGPYVGRLISVIRRPGWPRRCGVHRHKRCHGWRTLQGVRLFWA
jgi:hypothetical protein